MEDQFYLVQDTSTETAELQSQCDQLKRQLEEQDVELNEEIKEQGLLIEQLQTELNESRASVKDLRSRLSLAEAGIKDPPPEWNCYAVNRETGEQRLVVGGKQSEKEIKDVAHQMFSGWDSDPYPGCQIEYRSEALGSAAKAMVKDANRRHQKAEAQIEELRSLVASLQKELGQSYSAKDYQQLAGKIHELEVERDRLKQQLQELQLREPLPEKPATEEPAADEDLPILTALQELAPRPTIEVVEQAIASPEGEDVSANSALLTARQLAAILPSLSKNPEQTLRDWAKSKKSGHQKLANIGYQTIEKPEEPGKYYFRKLS